jgi:hypothetical protein
MPETPNRPPSEQARKPACSVCWEDFDQTVELDNHIRLSHPDRIGTPDELLAQPRIA